MPTSPLTDLTDAALRLAVKLNGSDMKEEYDIQSIQINHSINKISFAELILKGDVNIENGTMPITDGDDFNPGVEIEILAGYDGNELRSIFKGLIVKHIVELSIESIFTFKISCKHKAVKMTFNEQEKGVENMTDSAIIKAIISTYGFSEQVASSKEIHEHTYQKNITDWDFILSRCNTNGFIICPDADGITINQPDLTATPVLKVEAGISMIAFHGELDAENQPDGITTAAWDAATTSLITASATEPAMNNQGNIAAKKLAGALTQQPLQLSSATAMSGSELQTSANGKLLQKRLTAFKGSIKFIGNAAIKPGCIIEIDGVGKKLNGNAFVAAVTHSIDAGNWTTTAGFGLQYQSLQEKQALSWPAATGLCLAIVQNIAEDPAGISRILVSIPSVAGAINIWARMAHFYASGNAGAFFLPEIGDEVAIGFLDNDPGYPVILGSLYNGRNNPPLNPNNNNHIKAIVTKSKMKIEFDEEKKSIALTTPGSNSIIINDDGKSIEIKDQNSNSIILSNDGISLNSAKDITISAKGSITIDAVEKIAVISKEAVEISGLNVAANADIAFTAKGNATAALSSSGQTTVKGGIVMIN